MPTPVPDHDHWVLKPDRIDVSPELAAWKGLQIERCKRVSGANIGVYCLRRSF